MSKLCNLVYDSLRPTLTQSEERDHLLSDILYGGKYIDEYCIDRIARHYKLYNVNFTDGIWSEKISLGYFGYELNGIFLDRYIYNKFIKNCEEALSYNSLDDKIRFLLKLEYGDVIDNLLDSEFELISISLSDIDIDVTSKDCDYYSVIN
jgi:hypothetical protein